MSEDRARRTEDGGRRAKDRSRSKGHAGSESEEGRGSRRTEGGQLRMRADYDQIGRFRRDVGRLSVDWPLGGGRVLQPRFSERKSDDSVKTSDDYRTIPITDELASVSTGDLWQSGRCPVRQMTGNR